MGGEGGKDTKVGADILVSGGLGGGLGMHMRKTRCIHMYDIVKEHIKYYSLKNGHF